MNTTYAHLRELIEFYWIFDIAYDWPRKNIKIPMQALNTF